LISEHGDTILAPSSALVNSAIVLHRGQNKT
jgi:hypothetical protein